MRTFSLFVLLIGATLPLAAQSAETKTPARLTHADSILAGTYDLEVRTDGGTIVGLLTLSVDKGVMGGSLTVGPHSPTIQSVVHDGKEYVITAGAANVNVVYRLTFARDSLQGTFRMGSGLAGNVSGARQRSNAH